MKKLSILLSALLIGGILTFVSCSKTGQTGPAGQNGANGAPGPILYGSITGNVLMVNQYGVSVTNAYTNGYILLKNSATNATVDSVFANTSGVYTINNIPTGTYNMYAMYTGYGMNETANIVITAETRPYDIKLAEIPDFNVISIADSVWNGKIKRDSGFVYIYGTIAPNDTGARTVLVFIGNTSATSSAPGTYSFTEGEVIPQGTSTYVFTVSLNTFFVNGFINGSPVYLAVYGAANNYTYGDYTNYTYGQTVYTAIGASPVSTGPLSLP
jgi:hypothetical protein